MEWLRSFFPISSQSPQRAFNDEWVIVGDKTKTIDPELKKSLEAHFPKTAPQLFETCLARF
ncbi:MAG: hypothetical protein KDD43_14675, partial [Bdellovibrionales bacterium]|nr:hypothetical protein [Bdellovibrionales bacterium]